jgi:hypothetical protein
MVNYYISPSGNDTTGDGSAGNPWKTFPKAITSSSNGDEVRAEKTTITSATGVNLTWTHNTQTVTTSASLVGTIAINDLIGKPSAQGNGHYETYYRVNGINATTITLVQRYYGTTETVDGYKRLVPSTGFSPASGTVMCDINKNITVSGGWNLGTETRDGETWIAHLGGGASSSNVGIRINLASANNAIAEYINVQNCFNNIIINGVNCILRYVTHGNGERDSLSVNSFATNAQLDTVLGTVPIGSSYRSYVISNNQGIFNNIWCINSISTATQGAVFVGSNAMIENFNIHCCLTGIRTTTNSIVNNCIIKDCSSNGHYQGGNNTVVKNTSISNCTVGSTYLNGLYSNTYENVDFSFCANGVAFARSTGIVFDGCSFANNSSDLNCDLDSGDIFLYNCDSTTPTTNCIFIVAGTGTIVCKSCTIDAPSQSKALRIVTADRYTIPQYMLMNSFGVADGAYYSNGIVVKDTTVLTPDGNYSLLLAYTTTVNNNRSYMPVGSVYVKQGQGGTVDYKLRATGTWVGTITPVLTLNGKIITTGTPITSVSNASWDDKSLVADNVDITEDGELNLEFNINGNTIPINVGDIEFT